MSGYIFQKERQKAEIEKERDYTIKRLADIRLIQLDLTKEADMLRHDLGLLTHKLELYY